MKNHDARRFNHFQRPVRGGSFPLVAALLLPALACTELAEVAQAAITTSGNLTGTGTPYNGTSDPWATSSLTVGNSAPGTLSINSGSDVNNTGIGRIGRQVAASGSMVTVSGAGSTWTNTGSLTVAEFGTATLNITSGGSVSSAGGLTVAEFGTATLNITSGGSVSNVNGFIVSAVAGKGTVTVSGAGSTWTNTGSLTLGRAPTDTSSVTLNITSGGSVTNVNGIINSSRVDSGGTTVTVSGAGSTWTNSGNMTLGNDTSGSKATLNITGGGSVSNVNGVIHGGGSSFTRTLGTVSGAGSTWTNSGSLSVGATGVATLNINSGGLVVATALDGGNANSNVAFDGGTLRITTTDTATNIITLGAGGGTLDIPTAANTFTVSTGGISGAGGLTKTAAGTLALTAANTYTGGTTINGGTLLANNTTGSATGTGAVTVNNGGTLAGSGAIIGPTSVLAGGTLAPGNSIGTLTTGSITLASSATLAIELDLSLTPAADLLMVASSGTFSPAGATLALSLSNAPLSLAAPLTFLIVSNDLADPILGTFAATVGLPPGYIASLNYAYAGTDAVGRTGSGNDLAVTLSSSAAVPEAPAWMMFSVVSIGLVGYTLWKKLRRPNALHGR